MTEQHDEAIAMEMAIQGRMTVEDAQWALANKPPKCPVELFSVAMIHLTTAGFRVGDALVRVWKLVGP